MGSFWGWNLAGDDGDVTRSRERSRGRRGWHVVPVIPDVFGMTLGRSGRLGKTLGTTGTTLGTTGTSRDLARGPGDVGDDMSSPSSPMSLGWHWGGQGGWGRHWGRRGRHEISREVPGTSGMTCRPRRPRCLFQPPWPPQCRPRHPQCRPRHPRCLPQLPWPPGDVRDDMSSPSSPRSSPTSLTSPMSSPLSPMSSPASLTSWGRQGWHVVPEVFPDLPDFPNVVPIIPEVFPDLPDFPNVVPVVPDVFPSLPNLPNVVPVVPNVFPSLPDLPNVVPVIPDVIPVVPDVFPIIPDLPNVIPILLDVLPDSLECLPQCSCLPQHLQVSSPTSPNVFPNILGKTGKTCLPQHLRRRWGRHVFPKRLGKMGKTCLPQHSGKDREDMTYLTSQGR